MIPGIVAQRRPGGSAYTGPLDEVPGAVFAFDQYATSAAYLAGTPSYARLKRFSDDEELQFNFGADGPAPRDSIISWVGSSEPAESAGLIWNDGSGNANDTGPCQDSPPEWSPTTANNLPGFIFSSGKSFVTDSAASITSDEITVVAVAKGGPGAIFGANGDDGDGLNVLRLLLTDLGGGSSSLTLSWTDGSGGITRCTGDTDLVATLSQYFVVVGRLNNEAPQIRLNGNAISATTATTRASGAYSHRFGIGNDAIIQTNTFGGEILAVYLYPSYLSLANVQTLEQLFATRYNITLP